MVETSFADLGVSAPVVAQLAERGITEAFPIQSKTIEAALAGRDICGKAPTGSGKTLAFGLPIVELVHAGTPWRPSALILAPTRELASQIKDELEPLARTRGRSVVTVYGGTNIERDIRRLEKSVDILVACPGRLEDLISRRCCELRDARLVVVDEADRMADMGFLPSVKRILDQAPSDRHTMLFSATLDGDVDQLIKRYQNDPMTVEVEEQADDIGDVEHSWYLIQPVDRTTSAVAILRGYQSSIVFCRTRRGCDRVAKNLAAKGLSAVAIHGDRSQSQREKALRDFTRGAAQVLVATDVAARGIHVDNVALVMHYDPAGTDKDYIHRSGRTGRAGNDGRVISMVVEDKKKVARALQKDLGIKQGFDELVVDDLPPAVTRPEPKPDPKPDRPRNRNDRGDRRTRDDRSDHGRRSGQNQGKQSRGRSDSQRRDDRRDRDRDGRDDRRSGPKQRSQKPRRKGSARDWYPDGYDKQERPGGKGAPRRSSAKSSPKPGAKSGNRFDRDDEEQKQAGPGGSGSKKRKSRAAKGRHADRGASKGKGKRRPRS